MLLALIHLLQELFYFIILFVKYIYCIVTIVEIHMLIVDVCLSESSSSKCLMHYMITIFFRRSDYRVIAGFNFENSQIYEKSIHLKLIHRMRSENHICPG